MRIINFSRFIFDFHKYEWRCPKTVIKVRVAVGWSQYSPVTILDTTTDKQVVRMISMDKPTSVNICALNTQAYVVLATKQIASSKVIFGRIDCQREPNWFHQLQKNRSHEDGCNHVHVWNSKSL